MNRNKREKKRNAEMRGGRGINRSRKEMRKEEKEKNNNKKNKKNKKQLGFKFLYIPCLDHFCNQVVAHYNGCVWKPAMCWCCSCRLSFLTFSMSSPFS